MSQDEEANEHTQLLDPKVECLINYILPLSKGERALAETAIGERLSYNDYTTIDWLHDFGRIPSR
ncbi:hypothetical protein LHYA1_G002735 [Lachnellula hyalina]|uniref:Uncharacterized protein n=1 Tax=Lachnellula hyalina TaxID=1316788 RepID=A0A8H8U183_9HELO|nr:uncharacterized protein LHYA1_G002735 [Lachnellula hyalina]TVY28105.1 hypothetical protein LHYA1_G002735 [Lachnellula hyalina]